MSEPQRTNQPPGEPPQKPAAEKRREGDAWIWLALALAGLFLLLNATAMCACGFS